MEAELQAQIPGLDHVISEYSVVRLSAKHARGDGKLETNEKLINL